MLNVHNLSIAALAPKGESRFTLAAVLAAPPSKEHPHGYTCITDGHLLIKVDRPDFKAEDFPAKEGGEYVPIDETKPFIIPAVQAINCAREMPKKNTIPVLACAAVAMMGGERRLVTNDLETMRSYEADMPGSFPDVERVMPKKEDCEFAITLDARLLASLAGQIAKMGKQANALIPMTMYFRKPRKTAYGTQVWDTVLIEAHTNEEQEVTALLMPCRGAADGFMTEKGKSRTARKEVAEAVQQEAV